MCGVAYRHVVLGCTSGVLPYNLPAALSSQPLRLQFFIANRKAILRNDCHEFNRRRDDEVVHALA